MKRILSFILASLLLFSFTPYHAEEQQIKVVVDGQQLQFDVPPVVIDGRTLVPLRAIFESLSLGIGWDEATQSITGEKNGKKITLQIDNKIATVDDMEIELDVPTKLIEGRTMVPVRFIGQSTGANVEWDELNNTVLIHTEAEERIISINLPDDRGTVKVTVKINGEVIHEQIYNKADNPVDVVITVIENAEVEILFDDVLAASEVIDINK